MKGAYSFRAGLFAIFLGLASFSGAMADAQELGITCECYYPEEAYGVEAFTLSGPEIIQCLVVEDRERRCAIHVPAVAPVEATINTSDSAVDEPYAEATRRTRAAWEILGEFGYNLEELSGDNRFLAEFLANSFAAAVLQLANDDVIDPDEFVEAFTGWFDEDVLEAYAGRSEEPEPLDLSDVDARVSVSAGCVAALVAGYFVHYHDAAIARDTGGGIDRGISACLTALTDRSTE